MIGRRGGRLEYKISKCNTFWALSKSRGGRKECHVIIKHVMGGLRPARRNLREASCSFEETSSKIYLNRVHIPPTLKCHPP